MSIKGLLTGTGMRLAVATAVISGATLGSQTFNDDSLSFEQQITAIAPVCSPSSLSIPNQPSFASRSTSASTAMPVVAHSMPGSVSGGGIAVSSPTSSSSGGSAAGIYVSTPSSAGGGGGGSSAGGAGGSSFGGSSTGAATLAMATSSFAASAASAMRAPAGPKSLSPLENQLTLYGEDAPGVITGVENQSLDNTLIDNYGQPIGDAVLPLMILAMLFGWYVGRRKKLKEVMGN